MHCSLNQSEEDVISALSGATLNMGGGRQTRKTFYIRTCSVSRIEICPGNSRNRKRRACQYYLSWFRKNFIDRMKIELTPARLVGDKQEEGTEAGRREKNGELLAEDNDSKGRRFGPSRAEVREIVCISPSIIYPPQSCSFSFVWLHSFLTLIWTVLLEIL